MQKILLWMLIADFLVFSTAMRTSAEPGEFRTAYFQLRDTEQDAAQLQRLRLHGFNTVLVADGRYPLQEELWQRWATLARQFDLQLLPVLNFAVPREFKSVQERFRPYIDRDGVIYPATPCPVDVTVHKR